MGNSHSHSAMWYSTSQELVLSENNLTYVRTQNDARLGEVDEFQHNITKELLLRKEILLEDQTQLTPDNLRKLKARVQLKHENLSTIYGFSLETESEGPSKIAIFVEAFLSEAGTEFRSRAKEQSFFEEDELYTTLVPVIQALAYLQKYMISHGHITPEAILMSREAEIKILDHSLFEKEHSAYAACLQGAQIPYLAPELFALLDKNKDSFTDFDPFKADSFALGMTFLHGALLEEPNDCYNWETHVFEVSKLSKRIDRVREKYPGRFTDILSQLLKLNPEERPDAQALATRVKDIENTGVQAFERTYQPYENNDLSKKYEVNNLAKSQEYESHLRYNTQLEQAQLYNRPLHYTNSANLSEKPQYQHDYYQNYENYGGYPHYEQPTKYEKPVSYNADEYKYEPQNYDYLHKDDGADKISRFTTSEKPYYTSDNGFGHYTPGYLKSPGDNLLNNESRVSSLSSTYVMDPRVKEIIKEINEKKLFNKPEFSKFNHHDRPPEKHANLGYTSDEYRSPVSYDYRSPINHEYRSPINHEYHRSPVSQGHQDLLGTKTSPKQLATSGFIYPQPTPEIDESVYDPSRFVFNSPEVNEVIAKVRARHHNAQSQAISKRSSTVLNSNYLEPNAATYKIADDGRSNGTNTKYTKLTDSINIAEMKGRIVNEVSKTKRDEGVPENSSNKELALSKSQTKEDIMKNLKEKYGRKKKSEGVGSDSNLL